MAESHIDRATPSELQETPSLGVADTARSAERAFLDASVAVWRQIDKATARPGGYTPTWEESQEGRDLRLRERAAWERYRAVLDA